MRILRFPVPFLALLLTAVVAASAQSPAPFFDPMSGNTSRTSPSYSSTVRR